MFVFAFEGALLAFIVNGDRFMLFALLPRRKPRTSRQCSRLISTSPPAGTTLPLRRLADGMDFVCIVAVAPLPYIKPPQCMRGFTRYFCADRLAEVWSPCGGAAMPRVFVFGLRYAQAFSSSLRSSVFGFSLRFAHRCRSRGPCSRSRAQG